MGAYPTPQQDGGPGSQAGVSPAQQQASPIQNTLAELIKVCQTLAQQNPVLQPEFMEARSAFIKGLQKTMMAARPQEPTTPPPQ